MHEQFKCHDACSNAVRLMFNLSLNSQNWLEYRVSNKKNPKNKKIKKINKKKKPLVQFVKNLTN